MQNSFFNVDFFKYLKVIFRRMERCKIARRFQAAILDGVVVQTMLTQHSFYLSICSYNTSMVISFQDLEDEVSPSGRGGGHLKMFNSPFLTIKEKMA